MLKFLKGIHIINKMILGLFLSVILSIIAMTLVYCIPTHNMRSNVENDYHQIEYDYIYHKWNCYESGFSDTFITDLMINTSIHSGGYPNSALKNAMLNTRYMKKKNYFHEEPNLLISIKDKHARGIDCSYGRYWNGYLVVLKPLLYVFRYSDIKIFNTFLQLFLLIAAIITIKDKFNSLMLAAAFFVSYFIISPISAALSPAFSVIPTITLIAITALLKFDKINKSIDNTIMYFMFIGVLTSFFDLLTYPLITLGFPLIFYTLLNPQKDIKTRIKDILKITFAWGFGYAGMWILKWFIAYAITGQDFIREGIHNVIMRTAPKAGYIHFNLTNTLYKLKYYLLIPSNIIILSTFLIYTTVHMRHSKIVNINSKIIVPLLFIGLYPIFWSAVIQNHTYQHAFFTHKILAITVFAILSVYTSIVEANKLR